MASCYLPSLGDMISHTPIKFEPRNWTPVAFLIASLNRLEELDFFTTEDFTTDLMEAFSSHHPHCRLNLLMGPDMESFQGIRNSDLDTQALQLPGLHALTTTVFMFYTQSDDHQQLDDFMPLLLTSPGLKHLCLNTIDCFLDANAVDLLKATWRRLIPTIKPKAISQLESVTISGNLPEANLLFKLAATGDLSQLRSLNLGPICEPRELVNIAELLPNLKRLFLDVGLVDFAPSRVKLQIKELTAGILAFRPLEYLCIRGLRTVQDLGRIIQHHGSSLKELALIPDEFQSYPRLNSSQLLKMAILCPNLEELRIQVRRSMGDQSECEMYKALGAFSNLQRLFLDLDFNARPKRRRMYIGSETYFDDLRQTFINAAMDRKLALQIWDMIRNKTSRLKNLRIMPFGNQGFPEKELFTLDDIARSFLLTGYNLRDPGVPLIQRIGKEAWEITRARRNVPYRSRGEDRPLSDEVVAVFLSIWPGTSKKFVQIPLAGMVDQLAFTAGHGSR
ncbi:unnamed protein product [Penicillium salamii]|uniref:Uncharacterized protein n=1 Tax=Penicillium salamii TaxID=1612424 RepID=A0A9W4JLJ2_9EURO|nr:unnamed protein product [Penicillium salamii]